MDIWNDRLLVIDCDLQKRNYSESKVPKIEKDLMKYILHTAQKKSHLILNKITSLMCEYLLPIVDIIQY